MQGKVKKILLHIYSALLLFLASSWYVLLARVLNAI